MNEAERARRTADELEIRNVIAKLAIHADDGQVDAVAALMAEDIRWENRSAPDTPPIVGRAAFLAFANQAQAMVGPGSHAYHTVPTTVVNLDGDRATAKSYLLHVRDADKTPGVAMRIYNDAFVRTADGWKLSVRYIDPV